MIPYLDSLVSLAEWLFKTSLKASVLVALILIIQFLLGRKLSARWQYGLWLLLIIRLILPFDIESRLSIFNLVPAQNIHSLQPPNPAEYISTRTIEPTNFNVPATSFQIETEVLPTQQSFGVSTKEILALVWLLGLITILFYTFICNFKLWRKIRLQSILSSHSLFQLLETCKKQMKITRPMALIEMEGIRIPVLFGIFKPKILVPINFAQQMTADQIKHILLHELAHYKRKDVLVSCLTTILQIIHWFNPMIWFAFYRMRMDRELACDEMALNRIGAAQSQAYGQTIISLLETMTTKFWLPVTVSIIESKKDLKRRLAMIVNFKQQPLIWSIVAIIILIAVGGFALTDAQVNSQQTNSPAPQLSNWPDDKIQNIDGLEYQVFNQQVEQEIDSGHSQEEASANPQQNVSKKSTQHEKIQKPYRSEIIITFTSEGIKVDDDIIAVDSLAKNLN
ncbi:MAG: M56 family metallopeptidase, partial [candidate division KSB1 bacterium]|nr:M56 family metallopeptidase [candidate division KSB1 bacterium]